jgi:hypothetical protein
MPGLQPIGTGEGQQQPIAFLAAAEETQTCSCGETGCLTSVATGAVPEVSLSRFTPNLATPARP